MEDQYAVISVMERPMKTRLVLWSESQGREHMNKNGRTANILINNN